MRTPNLPSVFLALAAITTLACGDDGSTPAATTTATSGASGNDDGSGTMNDGMTGMGPAGDDNDDSQTLTEGGQDTVGMEDATDDAPGCAVDPQVDGSSCAADCECVSDTCFLIPALGGICGECAGDADCDGGGCTVPNPISDPPVGSSCTDGSAGTGCETTEVCQDDLECGTLIEVPDIFRLATCGECLEDADCEGEQLCSPTVDLASFSGERQCVEAGTVENGQICDQNGTGNEACSSGICATVSIMAVVQLGVCGECGVDGDCNDDTLMCADADIDTDTLTVIPPMCVPVR